VALRLKRFGEHVNDHQLDLIDMLEKKGRIIAVYDLEKLEEAIVRARRFKPAESSKKNTVLQIVESWIERYKSELESLQN
jgi:UDP-N-acetylglucosamine transferase subunit ALG13